MNDREKTEYAKKTLKPEITGHREKCVLCGADIHEGHRRVRAADGKPAHSFCAIKWLEA